MLASSDFHTKHSDLEQFMAGRQLYLLTPQAKSSVSCPAAIPRKKIKLHFFKNYFVNRSFPKTDS